MLHYVWNWISKCSYVKKHTDLECKQRRKEQNRNRNTLRGRKILCVNILLSSNSKLECWVSIPMTRYGWKISFLSLIVGSKQTETHPEATYIYRRPQAPDSSGLPKHWKLAGIIYTLPKELWVGSGPAPTVLQAGYLGESRKKRRPAHYLLLSPPREASCIVFSPGWLCCLGGTIKMEWLN